MGHGFCEGDEGQTRALYGLRRDDQTGTNQQTDTVLPVPVRPETHLVELILQDTGVQTQLSEPALFDRLDDAVHLGVVWRGEVGEVHMWRDEVVTQCVGIEVS